jgi:hypothetical protein
MLINDIAGKLKEPQVLATISQDLYTQSPEDYEKFKSAVISLDSSFQ